MDRNLSNTATGSFSNPVPLCWVYDFPNVSTQISQRQIFDFVYVKTSGLRVQRGGLCQPTVSCCCKAYLLTSVRTLRLEHPEVLSVRQTEPRLLVHEGSYSARGHGMVVLKRDNGAVN